MARVKHSTRLACVTLLGACAALAQTGCEPTVETAEWTPKPGLKTRWATEVDPELPLPEYPRPQMVRPDWMNLNGMWEFTIQPREGGPPQQYPDRILVPFPVESALSGVAGTVTPDQKIWYRRTFSLPDSLSDFLSEGEGRGRWLLHFGAVDWEAEVFLNGESLGTHRGGYDAFSFDITESLVQGQDQELVVGVWDPTDDGNQPRGKQVLEPHGIWYTAVSGIWQTVWLEPVAEQYVESLQVEPRLDDSSVGVMVAVEGAAGPVHIAVTVRDGGSIVSEADGLSDETVVLPIPDPRAWSPDDPFLYDLEVRLDAAGAESGASGAPTSEAAESPAGDRVASYFGLRTISVGEDEDRHLRLLLNGQPLFQYGLLDQGWWPDGLYTAPTDEALRFDVEKTRELGFNLIRKHVKIEPARWYYHCDRGGILVWQDMPSGDNEGQEAEEQFASELASLVRSLRNHPSIVMWVPFNEGWGQHATERYVEWIQAEDPSRLVNNASGWTDTGTGDVLDIHRYPGPGAPPPEALATPFPRVGVLGEFGGLGLPLAGHTWVQEDNWGYRSYETLEDLNRAYADLLTQLRPLIGEGLAAAVYTQTTDVEVEVNGVMTYDRGLTKLNDTAPGIHARLFGPPPILRPVVPTSVQEGQEWRFTTSDPGQGWEEPDFDDSGWIEGMGGFGNSNTPGSVVRTAWNSSEIWIRREFSLFLRIHHDEDAVVVLNGEEIASLTGYTTGYRLVPLTREAAALLTAGANTLAVHVRQTDGGQYIDVGIVEWVEPGG
jgi:hypothetical protein